MATVNRPPFWVPRPPDDNIWQWAPPRGALTVATTELKWYGAPGQVPTKRWWPHYTLNDPPEWQFPTFWMDSAVMEQLTHQKFFGAGGQGPTKNWAPQYTLDDPPPWQFDTNWMTSGVIQNLSHQQIYGQGGQVPPARWNFNYDETPPWQFTLLRNPNLFPAVAAQSPFFPRFWNFNYDETPPWQPDAANLNANAIYLTTTQQKVYGQPGQVPPARWSFNYDETPPWQADVNQLNSAIIQILSAAGKPVVPRFWAFNYDETPPWQANPEQLNSSAIQMLSAGGKPLTVRFRYEVDDAAVWQGAPIAMSALHLPQQAKPFVHPPQSFNYDETPPQAFWQPYNTNVTFTLSSFIEYAPRSVWSTFAIAPIDDPPTWQWAYHRNLNVNTGAVATPRSSPIWSFRTYSDDVGWVGQPTGVSVSFIPVNVPRAPFYALKPGDETYWYPLIRPSPYLPAAATPFVSRPWSFSIDDTAPSIWIPPRATLYLSATTAKPVSPVLWRFNYDDAPAWQWQASPNQALLQAPIQMPRAPMWALRAGFDTEWTGVPIGVGTVRMPTLPPVNVKNIYRWGLWYTYDVMGEPLWQGKPTPGFNLSIPLPPPKNKLSEWIIRARRRGRR